MEPAGERKFATTRWSLVGRARDGSGSDAGAALSELCAAYWLPLYAFARRDGHSESDAEDLVQGFFARFLSAGHVEGADPSKGRFRSWLMGAFRHHISNQRDRARARKRGGEASVLAIDVRDAESWLEAPAAAGTPPDVAYDRAFCRALLSQARDRLEAELIARERSAVWNVLAPHLGAVGDAVPHGEAATTLGISEVAVKVTLHRLRARFRTLLREEVARTLDDGDDVDVEIQNLLATL